MRILVAGALGEVGRTVSLALEDLGHTIIRVSSRAAELGAAGVVDFDVALELVRGDAVDAVVNAAGRGDRRLDPRSGLDATARLAPALRATAIPGVLLSTTRVLEGYESSHAEDAPAHPTTAYGESNAANEGAWLDEGGRTARILRITNYFAAPSSLDSPQAALLPWSLVTEALASGHIAVRSGASTAKEFVSAADVAKAVLLVLSSRQAPSVCATVPGAAMTLTDLVAACQAAFVAVGLREPTASFGPDGPAGPACLPGWLADAGWRGELTTSGVSQAVAAWLGDYAVIAS